jgi:hypothetical protein
MVDFVQWGINELEGVILHEFILPLVPLTVDVVERVWTTLYHAPFRIGRFRNRKLFMKWDIDQTDITHVHAFGVPIEPPTVTRWQAKLGELLNSILHRTTLPRHIVGDDQELVQQAREVDPNHIIILITGDRKLALHIRQFRKYVMMIDFDTWVHTDFIQEIQLRIDSWFQYRSITGMIDFLDYGYLESVEETRYLNGHLVLGGVEPLEFTMAPDISGLERTEVTQQYFDKYLKRDPESFWIYYQ